MNPTPLILLAVLHSAPESPTFDIDPDRVTVSGMSSGAYVAQQLHVGYSDVFHGVGVIAGGPWGCAEGLLATAMARCMGTPAPIDIDALAGAMKAAAEAGDIAPLAHLEDDPVWLFRATGDALVAEGVAQAAWDLYGRYTDRIVLVDDLDATHTFPSPLGTLTCADYAPPFVGNCGYDAAGALLEHLYGEVEDPVADPQGELKELPVPDAEAAHLLDVAFLYAPPACQVDECGLHVVLHGCAQSAATVQNQFIDQTGYQRWADANHLLVLYPQVKSSLANPFGCWDWWGYSGENYLTREAPQMKAVVDLVRALDE